jgi:hypothetical protein
MAKISLPTLRLIYFYCCAAFLTQVNAADTSSLGYGPPSAWVKAHIYDQLSLQTSVDASADQHLLLYEQQINAATNETFIHSVRQVLTLDGVQKNSTLSIDYSPSYQTLTWHWARLWRDGKHLERLDTNKVTLLQKEPELDQYLLDGQKSAVLILDDVRVGDIIDYAYSVKGANPVEGGFFSAVVPVQLSDPAGRLLTRVVWPKKRHLFARAHGCEIQPVALSVRDDLEYTWDLHQVPALAIEDSLPSQYDPQPWVQLSEFKTWAEVNRWAMALFQNQPAFSPELTQKITEWRQLPDQEQQILAVLRFVQEEVRYFGIEIGMSSEKPADPSTVFSRRFGDCKDKSRLFVSIVRALGIEAYPVLVNSTLGRVLDDWQPSADAFDHCIAVVIFDGRTCWLDPTMNYQRGPLSAHYLPDYARGLVVAPATTGLSVISQSAGLPLTVTTEFFQLGLRADPATLRVVTVAVGADADSLREFFANSKRTDIEKHYTHYYSDIYAGIKMTSPIEVDDDQAADRFQITEYYSIDSAWNYSDKDHTCRFSFNPEEIADLMKTPVDTERLMPLGIEYPVHRILRTEVTLPGPWPAEQDNKTISDPAFVFRRNVGCVGNKLGMVYEYEALADSVSPDSVTTYLQRLKQAGDSLGYSISMK